MPASWGTVAKGWLRKRGPSDQGNDTRSFDSDSALQSKGQPGVRRGQSADATTSSASKMSNDSAYIGNKSRPSQVPAKGAASPSRTPGASESGDVQAQSCSQYGSRSPSGSAAQGSATLSPSLSPTIGASFDTPSTAATPRYSAAQRSSFMLERASKESNRASLDAFANRVSTEGSDTSASSRVPISMPEPARLSHSLDQLQRAAQKAGVPEPLWKCYLGLVVAPPSTPLPTNMLVLLWGCRDHSEAEGTASALAQHGVLRIAHLEDGSAWSLPQPEHINMLQAHPPENIAEMHSALVDAYLASTRARSLAKLADDGYILQALGHHLTWARRLDDLKDLLSNPDWLEAKLHGYGTINVVADFRRYLMAKADDEVKLMLDAYQMSVSSCLQQPQVSLLRSQMAGRLLAVRPSAFQRHSVSPTAEQVGSGQVPALQPAGVSLEQAGGAQRMTLRGHTAGLQKVLLSPSGIDVITVSQDGTARVWDMEIGDCVLVMEGHTAPVTNAALAGTVLLTSSQDGTVRVWDMEQGQCLHTLTGHTAAVNAVAVTKDAKRAVSVSTDESARIWDLATGRAVHTLMGPSATSPGVIWSVALSPNDHHAITGSEDAVARVWNVKSGMLERELAGHTGWIMEVAMAPDGTTLLTASHDCTARVWDIRAGKCRHVLEGHVGRVSAVKVAADGATAITAADDNTARAWDIKTGACRHLLEGHSSWVSDAALTGSAGMGVTCSGDELAVAWDLNDGSVLRVLDGHANEVRSVVLTERGRFAVTASEDCTARVWDLQAKPLPAVVRHSSRVHKVSSKPGGTTAVSLGNDGIMLWDASGKMVKEVDSDSKNVRYLAVSRDGQYALTASSTSALSVWNLETGKCERSKQGSPGSRVRSFAASADLERAVIVLFDSSISVWETAGMSLAAVLQTRGERDANFGHSSGVNDAAISPDGGTVVTVSKDATARVWDADTGRGQHVLRGHTDSVTGARISADGESTVTYSSDGTARAWNLSTGNCMAVFQHNSAVALAVFSPDGAHVASCAADCSPMLWEVSSGRSVHKLAGHKNEVTDVAFSEDGAQLASSSKDSSLCLWDVGTGKLLGLFMADGPLTCCALVGGPGQAMVACGDESGTVHLLA